MSSSDHSDKPYLGTLFTVSAPSGAGKTSLVQALVEKEPCLKVSVSHTTRKMRPGEVDGVNYYFVDQAAFKSMVDADDFLEHAEVFGNFYGTSKRWVLETLQQGDDVILEIDWQGAALAKAWAESLLGMFHAGIFILPPSIDALRSRLDGRGQDDEAVIAARMAEAVEETSHYGDADYLVINDKFDVALEQLRAIVNSARLSIGHQSIRHQILLGALLAGK